MVSLSRWSTLPLLLSLLLLLPRPGLAAEDAPLALAPARAVLPGGPRLLDEPFQPQQQPISRGVRILAEFGGGIVGSLGGGLALGLLGLGLCETTGLLDGWLGCFVPAYLGAAAGAIAMFPVGAWWAGDHAGGDGSLLATAGGAAAGVVVGYLIFSSAPQSQYTGLSPLVLGVAGTLIGYELSQRSQPLVQPLLSVSPQGAVVGLGGRF
jgi:hypothetical protein